MVNIQHLEPISSNMPFSKKVSYANKIAANKVKKMRLKSRARLSSIGLIVAANLLQLAVISGVTVAIIFGFGLNSIQPQINTVSNTQNSTTSNNNTQSSVTGTENTDPDSLTSRTINAILKSKGVANFSDIKSTNDVFSKVKLVFDSGSGKITIRLGLTYSEVTRTTLRDAAKNIMQQIQNEVTDLQFIILATSDGYFIETASRTK